jgi:2-C-methyl-D-erythritol 4-phosphate cytidylyltransferase
MSSFIAIPAPNRARVSHLPSRIRTTDLSSCALIITAAGKGSRFGGYKQIAPLAGKPVVVHTIEAFFGLPFHSRIIVLPLQMMTDGSWDAIVAKYPHAAEFSVVRGKVERALSVRAGLADVPPDCEFVAVHDGVRPFPPIQAMMDCITTLRRQPDLAGAIVCSRVTDTIKRVDEQNREILRTEDRRLLRRAETPQVLRRTALAQALADLNSESPNLPTDEAEAVERLGLRCAWIEHDGFNPKITRPEDLLMAQAFQQTSAETMLKTD